jgi:hypothetical protein
MLLFDSWNCAWCLNTVWSLCIFLDFASNICHIYVNDVNMYRTFGVVEFLSAVVLSRDLYRTLRLHRCSWGCAHHVVGSYLTLEKEGYTFLRNVWNCKPCCTARHFRRLEFWPLALTKRQQIRVQFVRRAEYCCWLGKLMKYFVVSKLVDNAKKYAVSVLLNLIYIKAN